jgi:hypothetical protein
VNVAGERSLRYFKAAAAQFATQLVLVGNQGVAHQFPYRIVPLKFHHSLVIPRPLLKPGKSKARPAVLRPRSYKYTTQCITMQAERPDFLQESSLQAHLVLSKRGSRQISRSDRTAAPRGAAVRTEKTRHLTCGLLMQEGAFPQVMVSREERQLGKCTSVVMEWVMMVCRSETLTGSRGSAGLCPSISAPALLARTQCGRAHPELHALARHSQSLL